MRPPYFVSPSPKRLKATISLHPKVRNPYGWKKFKQVLSFASLCLLAYYFISIPISQLFVSWRIPLLDFYSYLGTAVFFANVSGVTLGLLVANEYCRACTTNPVPIETGKTWLSNMLAALILLALGILGLAYVVTEPMMHLPRMLYMLMLPCCLILTFANWPQVAEAWHFWLLYVKDPEKPHMHHPTLPLFLRFMLTTCAVGTSHFMLNHRDLQPLLVYNGVMIMFANGVLMLTTAGFIVAIAAPIAYRFWLKSKLAQIDDLRTPITNANREPDETFVLGYTAFDGTPITPEIRSFFEHAMIEGSNGSGKNALGMNPMVEQAIKYTRYNVSILDCKALTNEILEGARSVLGDFDLQVFTPTLGLPTHTMNVMDQEWFRAMPYNAKAEFFCQVLGVASEGEGNDRFYADMCFRVLEDAFRTKSDFANIKELADALLGSTKAKELTTIQKKTGQHPEAVLRRLAGIPALNVPSTIDTVARTKKPSVLYIQCPALRLGYTAGLIGRLWQWTLMEAQIYTSLSRGQLLFTDEFQVTASHNLAVTFQQARAARLGMICLYQNRKSLIKGKLDLASELEGNCRIRWWFCVSDADNVKRLSYLGGETIDYIEGESWSYGDTHRLGGRITSNASYTETSQQVIVPRLGVNDITDASNRPNFSVFQMVRGDNGCDFGGYPVIAYSRYHIDQDEYQRRCNAPLPTFPDSQIFNEPFGNGPSRPATPKAPAPGPAPVEVVEPPSASRGKAPPTIKGR